MAKGGSSTKVVMGLPFKVDIGMATFESTVDNRVCLIGHEAQPDGKVGRLRGIADRVQGTGDHHCKKM